MPRRKAASGTVAAIPWSGASSAVRPMLATLADRHEVPLVSERLTYEPKYDGIRALVAIEPKPPAAGRRPPAASPRPPAPSHRCRPPHVQT